MTEALLRSAGYYAPKDAQHPGDWMDACYLRPSERVFAVADGASNNSFGSRQWAQHLVEAFVNQPSAALDQANFTGWLEHTQGSWDSRVTDLALPASTRRGYARGSFSTLCGLAFQSAGDGSFTWHAVAVGDSCLLRPGTGGYWPLTSWEEFDSRPDLLSTVHSAADLSERARFTSGVAQPGDVFFLVTDAFAQWYMKVAEDAPALWKQLMNISQEKFLTLVSDLQSDGRIERDDVTFVKIEIADS